MLLNGTLASALATTTYEPMEEGSFEEDEDSFGYYANNRLFLSLRYFARHCIPIFCIVGILGNCMALMLIRLVFVVREILCVIGFVIGQERLVFISFLNNKS